MIDYNYYANEFGGSEIPMDSFNRYSNKATNIVKSRLMKDIPDEYLDAVKMVCCEIAELLYNQTKSKNSNITSEKVGDYSVSYSSVDNTDVIINNEIETLSYTGLLYSGISVY